MPRRAPALFAVLLLGCGYPTYVYVDDASAPDTAAPGEDTDTPPDAEVPLDGCAKPNGCGGCDDQGIKGSRCEPCGQWTCDGTNVVCTPASPAPGTTCGLCKSSTMQCTAAGTTACATEDDRLVYEDAAFKTKDEKLHVVDRSNEVFIAFDSVRSMTYVDASVALRRIPYSCARVAALPHPDSACSDCKPVSGGFDCTVPAPTIGELTVTLYTGTIVSRVPLATGTISATTVPDSAGFITIPFSTPVSPRPVGTPLILGLTSDSSGHAFEVYGGGASAFPPAPMTTKWWRRTTRPEGTLTEEPTTDLAHVLRGKACAP